VLLADVRQDRYLGFAVATPVRPKEEEHRTAAEGGDGGDRSRADPLDRIERGGRFAFQTQQVDVLANPLGQRGCRVSLQLFLKIDDRLSALTASRQDLPMDFYGRADRGGKPGIVIELPAVEKLCSHLAGLCGKGIGAVEFARRQVSATQPRNGSRQIGPWAGSGLRGFRDLLGSGEVVLRDRG